MIILHIFLLNFNVKKVADFFITDLKCSAIYLAEKYNLLTIVISPLIGLMNDQVKNLELKNLLKKKKI